MTSRNFETWDVFAERAFKGNPLAVVLDGAGLDATAMQRITGEFNLSETTFVLPPEDPAHTARVRIFTLGYEMPFAGHPTVGTSIALARSRGLSGELTLELNAGLFRVIVEETDSGWFAEFQNPNLPDETGAAPSADLLEAAMGLAAGALDRDAAKPRRIGSGGVNFVYCKASLEAVRAARLNHAAFKELDIGGGVGVYLYAEGGESDDAAYHARMFAPGAGIAEDPATGSAAASLPGHLALSGDIPDGEHRWLVEQGFEMGRPSRIALRVTTKSGAVAEVNVGGAAVRIQEGRLLA